MTEHRPWGQFTILMDSPTCKVKELVVHPEQRLSYQYHHKRDEHWYVVSGTATVVLDDEIIMLSKGKSIDIMREQKHRIGNTGNEPVVIIEVQTGEYFGEDDIVRLEDDYART